jgi:sugar lactone lactonase YvrE
MPLAARLAPIAAFALVVALSSAPARAGDPVDLSVSAFGEIWRWDPDTGVAAPFATGLGIPFYGVWATDGFLYMPDRGFGIVWKISPAGVPTPFAAGGWLTSVVTVIQAPDGTLYCSDVFNGTIVRLGANGSQTLLADAASSGGLLLTPGGLASDLDGTLYVANNLADTIARVDPATGAVALVSDGQGLLSAPGGLVADGAGNLFVANYGSGLITRIRVADGEASIFCDDPTLLSPNDLRLQRGGGLRVTTKNHKLAILDAAGQLTVLYDPQALGELVGNVSPADGPPCDGRYVAYGAGLGGSGGFVPELRALFSPCPGAAVALEVRRVKGGATGVLAWGLAPAALPFKGGQLLVDLGPPGGLVPLAFPGAGPGGGGLLLPFTLPDDVLLTGVSFFLQVLAADPGAAKGISLSNGLEERIGG